MPNKSKAYVTVVTYYLKVVIYKADFEEERRDREEAHSKLANLEMKENEFMERIAAHQKEVRQNSVIIIACVHVRT